MITGLGLIVPSLFFTTVMVQFKPMKQMFSN